jgi:ABC-type transport system substrate-binding protein
MVKFKVVRLCKEEAMSVVPTEAVRYDLDKAAALLREKGYEVQMQGPMVIAKAKEFEATLYTSGRLLVSRVETKEKAAEAANSVYEAVEGSLEPLVARRS